MLAMARHMLQHEGVGGFFKGLTPALLRQGVYSSIRVGIYEPIREFYSGGSSSHPTYGQRVLSGGTAGAIGILFANPTELIKIRMQADRTGTRYSGVADAFRSIIKTEGRSCHDILNNRGSFCTDLLRCSGMFGLICLAQALLVCGPVAFPMCSAHSL